MINELASQRTIRTSSVLVNALCVSLGAAIGQGFARFGYALILPSMRAQLRWSYAQAGLINSANALGYLVGALLVGPIVARWHAPWVVRISLLAISLSMIATGLVDQVAWLLVARIVSGLGAGLLFVAGVSIVLAITPSSHSELAVGVYYGGPGIGIVLSGLLVPLLLGPLAWSWQSVWIAMGVIGLATLALVELPLRTVPQTTRPAPRSSSPRLVVAHDYWRLWPALTAYTLYGLGYIGYLTFVVAFLQSIHVAPPVVQAFWVLLGICAAGSGFTWRPIIRRLPLAYALSTVLALLTVGTLLPVLITHSWSFMLSAVLFGSSFLAVITTLTLQVRVLIPRARWTTVLGNATALFALGQLVGPTLTGIVADRRGGLALGLLGSAAVLGLSALIALLQPRPTA